MNASGGDEPEEQAPTPDSTSATPAPPTPVPPKPVPPTPVRPQSAPQQQQAPQAQAAAVEGTDGGGALEVRVTEPTPQVPTDDRTTSTEDWPAKAADGIVDLVDSVREATTGRALTAATGLVYGIVIAGAATTILILGTIVLFRLNERAYAALAEGVLDLPDPQPMWAVYVTWGLICLLLGLVLWRKRPRLETPAAER